MARIFILEPEPELRELLARVVRRLGHEPVTLGERTAGEIAAGDVLILEPGDGPSYEAAADVHRRLPAVPIVCVSVLSEVPGNAEELDPVAHVMKPFRLADLERALRKALERERRGQA
jgi:DNA-binding response OmpR family regulator